jgi:DNA-binding NarL/FixJ family response regulator
MTEPFSVLIVDDQPRARQSLKALVASAFPRAMMRMAADGQEAIRLIEQVEPDLVLMDVRMPKMDGLAATRSIRQKWPEMKVILLSMYADSEAEALAAGADAFIFKGDSPAALLSTLEAVVGKEI